MIAPGQFDDDVDKKVASAVQAINMELLTSRYDPDLDQEQKPDGSPLTQRERSRMGSNYDNDLNLYVERKSEQDGKKIEARMKLP